MIYFNIEDCYVYLADSSLKLAEMIENEGARLLYYNSADRMYHCFEYLNSMLSRYGIELAEKPFVNSRLETTLDSFYESRVKGSTTYHQRDQCYGLISFIETGDDLKLVETALTSGRNVVLFYNGKENEIKYIKELGVDFEEALFSSNQLTDFIELKTDTLNKLFLCNIRFLHDVTFSPEIERCVEFVDAISTFKYPVVSLTSATHINMWPQFYELHLNINLSNLGPCLEQVDVEFELTDCFEAVSETSFHFVQFDHGTHQLTLDVIPHTLGTDILVIESVVLHHGSSKVHHLVTDEITIHVLK